MVIDPGNWNEFIYREDNKGLTLLEMKTKYLQEKLNYDNFRSYLLRESYIQQQQNVQSNSSAGGDVSSGPGKPSAPVANSSPPSPAVSPPSTSVFSISP